MLAEDEEQEQLGTLAEDDLLLNNADEHTDQDTSADTILADELIEIDDDEPDFEDEDERCPELVSGEHSPSQGLSEEDVAAQFAAESEIRRQQSKINLSTTKPGADSGAGRKE